MVDQLHALLDAKLAQASRKSALAEAICYALTRCAALTRFLDDCRIELDSDAVKRSIQPIALTARTPFSRGRTTAAITGGDRVSNQTEIAGSTGAVIGGGVAAIGLLTGPGEIGWGPLGGAIAGAGAAMYGAGDIMGRLAGCAP